MGHPKHGRYAETRVGDQRDKKSAGKDRSCSTQAANNPEAAGEAEDNVARKGMEWPYAVGSGIPLFLRILKVGGDHHTHRLRLRQLHARIIHGCSGGQSSISHHAKITPESLKDRPTLLTITSTFT